MVKPKLQHMAPAFTMHDCADLDVCQAMFASKRAEGFALGVPTTDGDNLGLGHFGASVIFSTPNRHRSDIRASLLMHVGRIVGFGAKKKMVGPHALRVIAAVTDTQTFRDGSMSENPAKAMRAFQSFVDDHGSVSEMPRGAVPDPAGRGDCHLGPEALFDGSSHGGTVTYLSKEINTSGLRRNIPADTH